jgi:hypothetical protein
MVARMGLYNTEISRGSLLPIESKRIAHLLLKQADAVVWTNAIEVENILQKDTVNTANRQANLIRKRLITFDSIGWKLIIERESEVSNQLLFAAAIKQSRLLGDFMCNVYAKRQRQLETTILASNWEEFLVDCSHHDPTVFNWNVSTKSKALNGIVRILVEAKYMQDRKSMTISPKSLHPDVKQYLQARDENYVIDCLERSK